MPQQFRMPHTLPSTVAQYHSISQQPQPVAHNYVPEQHLHTQGRTHFSAIGEPLGLLLGASLSANKRPAAPPHSQPRASHSAASLHSGRNYQQAAAPSHSRPRVPHSAARLRSGCVVQCPGAKYFPSAFLPPQCPGFISYSAQDLLFHSARDLPTVPRIHPIQCPGSTPPQCPGFNPQRAQDQCLRRVTSGSHARLPSHRSHDLTDTMGRVKIKHPRPRDIGVRRQLLAILAPGVKVTRLIPANDAVVVLTPTDKDADAIFQNGIPARLAIEGFTPVVPPELRAQRTVICAALDDLIYEHSPEKIIAEVRAQHDWAVAESVFKFPHSTTIKITFKDSDMARKAISEGIHLFQIHVPGHQMRQEIYTPLLTCNRCNAVENHPTRSCPQPPDYVRCSECSIIEHSYRDCTASTKKCLSCGEEYSARAMRCPTRKEAIKRKEAAVRQAQAKQWNTSYAQAAQATPSPTRHPTLDPSKTLDGLICLFHAHLANASSPGCFQQTLSASLAENGQPDVKLPPPPPFQAPEAIIRAFSMGAAHTAPLVPTASHSTTDAPPASDDAGSVASSAPSSSSDEASEASEQDSDQELSIYEDVRSARVRVGSHLGLVPQEPHGTGESHPCWWKTTRAAVDMGNI
ncbi:hypothetical protein O3P69_006260 [Scylla paramamosain]|uniref:Gag-like protein n=1 Tax=Scylla paramamosain TaxID=85552 RepID=A0AAW0U7Z4_SCYPA